MSEVSPRGTVTVSFGEVCDRGKVREENQDSVRSASIPLGELFVVADGIGGYQGGATASLMVVEGFHSQLAALPAGYPPDRALQEASAYTNGSIHAAALSGDPSLARMGSTVVLALIQTNGVTGPEAWIGHIGDSRAYLIRNGQMTRITNDHSAVQALLSRNLITEEEARYHPDSSVLTRSLGHRPEVEIEIDHLSLQAGDALLLCSDGLWGYVADADIAGVTTDDSLSARTVAETLLHQALAAGGHDNIGIHFVRIEDAGSIPVTQTGRLGAAMPASANAPPVSGPGSAFGAPQGFAQAGRQRRRLILAIILVLLGGLGVLGVAFRRGLFHHQPPADHQISDPQKNSQPASNTPGATVAPQAAVGNAPSGESGGGPAQSPVSPRQSSPRPVSRAGASQPEPAPRHAEKKILLVGEHFPAWFEAELLSGSTHWRQVQVERVSSAACATHGGRRPVVYARSDEDLNELLDKHPRLKKHVQQSGAIEKRVVKDRGSDRRSDQSQVWRDCGESYDVIVLMPKRS